MAQLRQISSFGIAPWAPSGFRETAGRLVSRLQELGTLRSWLQTPLNHAFLLALCAG